MVVGGEAAHHHLPNPKALLVIPSDSEESV
jgi:hypothetical protein